MKRPDLGEQYAERKIKELERTLNRTYKRAGEEIEEKLKAYTARFEKQEALYVERVKTGTMTQKEFDKWKAGKVFYGEQWKIQQQNIAEVLANTNDIATKAIRGEEINVFSYNANWMAYDVTQQIGAEIGFDIYNQDAVMRLLKEDPNIIPFKKLDKKKDIKWNFKNIRAEITQGIIQGEGIPQIAARLADAVPNRNKQEMVKHARTAMTSAQNGGRLQRMKECQDLGIDLEKIWIATLDTRTRETHQILDQQTQKIDKPFVINGMKIMYPGDPHARPELVYNCRCRLDSVLKDYPHKFNRRVTETGEIISGMSYAEWVKYEEGKAA